ncbi:MAG: DUF4365 domain-containing protein [Pseudomonadota bacterium]|nr:DUF4365 domain-containing protein [Pseudomonadota bacterium]
MALRTPQQELEEVSRRRFLAAVPRDFVLRDEHPDFGYDFELELFVHARSSGRRMLLQLKATERQRTEGRLSIRFMTSRLVDYFYRSSLPVLLAAYDGQGGKFRVMWAETLRARLCVANDWYLQETHSVDFMSEAELDDEQFANLANELLAHPIPPAYRTDVRVAFYEEPASSLIAWLATQVDQRVTGPGPKWMELVPPELAQVVVRVFAGKCVVYRQDAGLASCIGTVGVPQSERPSDSRWSVPPEWKEAATGLALVICHAASYVASGKGRIASVLRRHQPSEPMDERVFFLQLAESIELDGSVIDLAYWAASDFGSFPKSYTESLFLTRLLSRSPRPAPHVTWSTIAQRRVEASQGDGAAVYSLANTLQHEGDWGGALHQYLSAARSWPAYRRKPYWYAEVAVCLFELGRFRIAARCYLMASTLRDFADEFDVVRAGDAWLHAGLFDLAYQALSSDTNYVRSSPCWMLKAWVSQYLLARFGPRAQSMMGKYEQERLRALMLSSVEGVEIRYRAAMSLLEDDPTTGLNWANAAVAHSIADEGAEAAHAWVVTAALQHWDCSAAAHAVLFCLSRPEMVEPMLYVLWSFGRRDGTEFLESLDALLEQQAMASHVRDGVREALGQLMRESPDGDAVGSAGAIELSVDGDGWMHFQATGRRRGT